MGLTASRAYCKEDPPEAAGEFLRPLELLAP
jgi:hypothetical protein